MYGGTNFNAPRVSVHDFTMVPKAEIPRSSFRMMHQHKTTFAASQLIPVLCLEVLPGDTFNINMTAFMRVNTPLFPLMDNMDLETWFFFVPNRIVWQHWVNFCGEQPATPTDSISYSIPQINNIPAGGITFTAASGVNTLYDYFGIPGHGAAAPTGTYSINALPFRAYNLIVKEWFRDQNLQNSPTTGATQTVGDYGDGPDPYAQYATWNLAKRHDYFTSCLPWTQKGGVPVGFLQGSATVQTVSSPQYTGVQQPMSFNIASTGGGPTQNVALAFGSGSLLGTSTTATTGTPTAVYPSNLVANLGTATTNTINTLRLAFQTQKLLERDARGGTRYVESLLAHWGVRSPDFRLQRPKYQGGGKTPINISPVPQTSATGLTGGTTPIGSLAAVGVAVAHGHGMRGSFTEHGHILGLMAVRADQIYQQGLHRMWTRQTRYDFYWPVFAMLGEQGVRNDEIWFQGAGGTDTQIFGYQEAWASYRFIPSRTSGMFRSTTTGAIDGWHLAINFGGTQPNLNAAFIADPLGNNILGRNLAGGSAIYNEQFLIDMLFDIKAARLMPLYSVPGLIDHF